MLLNDPNAETQASAQKILSELPEPPPLPTREVSDRVTAHLHDAEESVRHRGLLEICKLQSASLEIRQALGEMMRQDSSLQLRVDARIELARLAPDDPALAAPPPQLDSGSPDDFMGRLDRNQVPVLEMLEAIAGRRAAVPNVIQRLAQVDATYWNENPEEKRLTQGVLASLHRDRDATVYEAATDAYSILNRTPRAYYSLDRLAPYFAAMESALTPGEYAISMRDLKSSLDSYWTARSFNQSEPTHLPADLVQILLVGPCHQNRPAYEAMLEAILKIDPAFRLPSP